MSTGVQVLLIICTTLVAIFLISSIYSNKK